MTRPKFLVRPTSITRFTKPTHLFTPSAKFILMIIIWAIRLTSCFIHGAHEKILVVHT